LEGRGISSEILECITYANAAFSEIRIALSACHRYLESHSIYSQKGMAWQIAIQT
jgi:hypothetical protein